MECFDPESGVWTELNMPAPRYRHSLVSYGNQLILMGGKDERHPSSVWKLDPLEENRKWKELPSLNSSCFYPGGVVLG